MTTFHNRDRVRRKGKCPTVGVIQQIRYTRGVDMLGGGSPVTTAPLAGRELHDYQAKICWHGRVFGQRRSGEVWSWHYLDRLERVEDENDRR